MSVARSLLRPLSSGDLCLQFLAIRPEKYQIFAFDGGLHRITDDQTVSGVTGVAPHPITSCTVYDTADLHGKIAYRKLVPEIRRSSKSMLMSFPVWKSCFVAPVTKGANANTIATPTSHLSMSRLLRLNFLQTSSHPVLLEAIHHLPILTRLMETLASRHRRCRAAQKRPCASGGTSPGCLPPPLDAHKADPCGPLPIRGNNATEHETAGKGGRYYGTQPPRGMQRVS